MSYDIYLKDQVTKATLMFDAPHSFCGGTYAVGGTAEAWLNVTWNYGKHFKRVLGEKGIREIYGKTGAEAIPLLKAAIQQLADNTDDDYWKPTEGNAKQALCGLLAFAEMRTDGVFDGD